MSQHSQTVRAAWITARDLVVGVLVGGMLGATFRRVPISVLLAASIVGVSAGWWGRHMTRLTGLGHEGRIAWSTGSGVSLIVVLVGATLASVEPVVVEQGGGAGLPTHIIYSLLFVPAVLLIASVGGFALGFGARDIRLGATLAVRSGLSAALAFLVIDLLMDALGWRVGGPNAGHRATMLVVTTLGAVGAALAAGAALGYRLTRRSSAML